MQCYLREGGEGGTRSRSQTVLTPEQHDGAACAEMTGKEDPVETLGALHTIAELRQAVAQLTGKGADTFNLTLQGHLLKDGEGTLGSHGIEEGVVVVMTPGSQPGPQPDVDEGVPEPPEEGVPPAQP